MFQRLALAGCAICLLLSVMPAVAFAQAPPKAGSPKVGLTMSSPSTVGVIWHVSNRVAIRPDLTFTTGGTRYSDGSGTYSNWAATAGISALFYVGKWDAVRAYVSPRFAYARTHSSSSNPTYSSSSTTSVPSGSGSFGVQFAPHRRFMVFGEAGLNYSRQAGSSDFTLAAVPAPSGFAVVGAGVTTHTVSPKSHSWSSRTVIGVAFYF